MATTEIDQRLAEIETSFSERLARLEAQVSRLSQQVGVVPNSHETAWWKKIVGVFQDDPEFEEAMRLGREYRESQRVEGEDAAQDTV